MSGLPSSEGAKRIIELLETEERLLAERQKLEVEIAPLAATTKGNR